MGDHSRCGVNCGATDCPVLRSAAMTIDKDAEVARLTAQLESILKWQQEGEALFARGKSVPVWFHLGAWWADRPWRDVPRVKL